MPYVPEPGEGGYSIFVPALRDFLASDVDLVEMLGGDPADTIIQEGLATDATPKPAILVSSIGDGESAAGEKVKLVRLIMYVIDEGRGYYAIDNILARLRFLLRRENIRAVMNALTFPPDAGFCVLGYKAPGTTATATHPELRCEAKGLYTFLTLMELEVA